MLWNDSEAAIYEAERFPASVHHRAGGVLVNLTGIDPNLAWAAYQRLHSDIKKEFDDHTVSPQFVHSELRCGIEIPLLENKKEMYDFVSARIDLLLQHTQDELKTDRQQAKGVVYR